MIRGSNTGSARVLSAQLRIELLERHRSEALELVAEALGRWRDHGFTRYDNLENSCTVRVYSWMLAVLEEWMQGHPVQIIVVPEGFSPTAEQLAGRASVSTAKRPDLVMYLGGNHAVRMCIECKRFLGAANASQYTENGIMRFVRGFYETDNGRAAMVGYVMTSSIETRIAQVNGAISSHSDLSSADHLEDRGALGPVDHVQGSSHLAGAISLTHLFVDMVHAVKTKSGILKPVVESRSAA